MANAAASSSKNNNDEIRIWVESIEKERRGVSSLLSVNSIFRVPLRTRNLKPEAYTPQLVSIGPLHYNEEHLQPMQAHKLRYLNHFLSRPKGKKTSNDYVKAVSAVKEDARKCYSEIIGKGFQEDEFVKIMVIDGCFILELLEIKKRQKNDELVSNDLWYYEILDDLINLENQLPFCVLKCLYDKNHEGLSTPNTLNQDIIEILLTGFVKAFYGSRKFPSIQFSEGEPKHILDLLKNVMESSMILKNESTEVKELYQMSCASKLKELYQTSCAKLKELYQTSCASKLKGAGESTEVKELYQTSCASKLKGAGVKFQKKESTSLFDISFDKDKGELTIPAIAIDDSMEHVLRNLIAFDQCQQHTDYFATYATFMDGLINTDRDVELLEEEGIIESQLGNPEDVVILFNNIVKFVVINNPYLSGVIEGVNNYQRKPWNKWRAILIENYFNTPWALISFLAALFLLILTVVQTVCSILPVVRTKP